MGMFDWLECDIPLPLAPPPGTSDWDEPAWQTKDLSDTLRHWRITVEGTLVVEHPGPLAHVEYDAGTSKHPVRFYGWVERDAGADDAERRWVEYSAHVRRGRVLSIELVEDEARGGELAEPEWVWPPGGRALP